MKNIDVFSKILLSYNNKVKTLDEDTFKVFENITLVLVKLLVKILLQLARKSHRTQQSTMCHDVAIKLA